MAQTGEPQAGMGLETQGRSIGDRDPEGRDGPLPSNQSRYTVVRVGVGGGGGHVDALSTPVDVRVQICRIVRLLMVTVPMAAPSLHNYMSWRREARS